MRDGASPHTTLRILQHLIDSCEAAGVEHISITDLQAAMQKAIRHAEKASFHDRRR